MAVNHSGDGVAFRVDASLKIGSGHMVRCLTLADALSRQGFECHLITRAHDAVATRVLANTRHTVHWLPPADPPRQWPDVAHAHWLEVPWSLDASETADVLDANAIDWLVVDHYALDARWERAVGARHLLVIDDLADRAHQCSLLLDANFGRIPDDYDGLLSAAGPLLLGARYALLRPEFHQRREAAGDRLVRQQVRQVLLALGGTDMDDVTSALIRSLSTTIASPNWQLDVVVGAGNPHAPAIERALQDWRGTSQMTVAASDLADRMLMADLAIGAAGTMAWERCCLGLPTLAICLADNQRYALEALQQAGAARTLSCPDDAADWLRRLNDQPGELQDMSRAAMQMVDGLGTQRVIEAMASYRQKAQGWSQ